MKNKFFHAQFYYVKIGNWYEASLLIIGKEFQWKL